MDQSKITPMMKQYLEIKKNYHDEILFFRLGDFYEMFFDDAVQASSILSIALTSRQNDIPMCGIPYHASESYIARLIKAGHRVAICEQMEQTPSAGTVVRREVTRIITAGTVIESNLLQGDDNNFLVSIIMGADRIGMAFVDVSTGDFFLSAVDKRLEIFRGEIRRFAPREALFRPGADPGDERYADFVRQSGIPVCGIHEWYYDADYLSGVIRDTYRLANLKGLGIGDGVELMAAGSALQYLADTQKKNLGHLKFPQRIISSDYMLLDDATIASLELVGNQSDGGKNRTLFSVLNFTKTAMGRRCLERNILQPLRDRQAIERRLDIVQYLHAYHDFLAGVQGAAAGMGDLERIVTRFTMGRFFPRDFLALTGAVRAAHAVRELIAAQPVDHIAALASQLPDCMPLAGHIAAAIEDNPALGPEHGRVIRQGYLEELDRLYQLKNDARGWILAYQEEEKKRLDIPSLKVRYNRILGYFIEVSKTHLKKIPDDYFRKQTLVNAERYTSQTLQKFEADILAASDKITMIENEEIRKLVAAVLAERESLQSVAARIGEIDFLASLARAALDHKYVRPRLNREGIVRITDGRHPMVERYYTREVFIPNDISLDAGENMIKIITGPNMSGKSTYIRMAGVIQLMAQIGSFVPAADADMPIVDRIFTRIGASDNIAAGESTFLVEMNETAVILNNATADSLIIMDEVGRGTSTYDGLSIAWAVVEHISRYIRARTLFATHYHELTELGKKAGISNYTVLVRESAGGVDFLHKVVPGSADKSYGIHVANLAGIPRSITARATAILERLEKKPKARIASPARDDDDDDQLEIFNAANHRVLAAIRSINAEAMTPMDAINELYRLKKMIE